MNIRPRLIRCLGLFALAACNHNEQAKVNITPTSIYNIDTVRAAIASGPAGKSWDRKLNQAVALINSKRLYAEAADSIRKIIYTAPSPKAYFELGTALLMGGNNPEAIQALTIAEKLQYAPLYNVLYGLSAAYASLQASPDSPYILKMRHDSVAAAYLQVAIQMGYPNPELLLKDPALKDLVEHRGFYYDAIAGAIKGRANVTRNTDWAEFINGFEPLSFPMTIDAHWLYTHDRNSMAGIEFTYERFITEMHSAVFSRATSPDYFYIGKVSADSNYIAVIYAGSNDWHGDDYSFSDDTAATDPGQDSTTLLYDGKPVFFYLTTYTTQGKIIDKILVAGREAFSNPNKALTMTSPSEFSISDQAIDYKKDPGRYGHANNPIVSVKITSTQHYHINNVGRFEKVDMPQMASK